MDISIIISTFLAATLQNPTFMKEFGLLLAAAAIMKPLLTAAIKAGIKKAIDENKEPWDKSVKSISDSVTDLSQSLKEYTIQNDKKLNEGDRKFKEHSEKIERAVRQIEEFGRQIRYLFTKMQLDVPPDHDEPDEDEGENDKPR